MKTLKNTMIAMLALFAVSCNTDDVENRPVVQGENAPVLEAPEEGNTYTLNPETLDQLAERFVWTAANFGEGIIPDYDIEIDFAGENFDTPAIIGTTNGVTQLAVSVNILNTALETLGATPFETATFQVRIKAYVGESVLHSNAVEMIITPFSTESPKLYLRGNFLSASGYGDGDWGDNTNPPYIEAEAFGSTSFEGYVYMNVPSPEFKLIPNATGFDGDYGDADASGASGELLQGGETKIKLATAGYYWVKANTDPGIMTYSATLTNWAVTGSGTPNGWPDGGAVDHDMTYDPVEKVWKITLTLVNGEIKFRANDDWAINYGDAGADGVLDFNDGTNIQVTAGTYEIKLNLSNPRNYTYTLTQQ